MIFESLLEPKWVLIVDCFSSDLLIDLTSYSGENRNKSNVILERLFKKYPFFSDVVGEVNLDNLAVITFGASDVENRDIFKYVDDNRYLVYKDIIHFKEDVCLIPMGKNMLYAVTKNKGILAQVNKIKHISVEVEPKKVLKYKVIPTYNLEYIHYNPNILSNFYNTFNSLILNNTEEVKTLTIPKQLVTPIIDKIIKDKSIEYVYFDIETDNLSYTRVIGVSVDYEGNKLPPFYIPFYDESIKSDIHNLLKAKPIIGHNLDFDISHLVHAKVIDFDDVTIKDDTLLLAHLIYNKSLGGLSLKFIAKTILAGVPDWEKPLKDYIVKNKLKNYSDVPSNLLYKYASLDVYYTKLIYRKLIKKLPKESEKLYNKLLKIEKMIAEWELRGIQIDKDVLKKVKDTIQPNLTMHLKTIYELPESIRFEEDEGHKVNLNSSKQLNLFSSTYLNIDNPYKTKAGKASFAAEFLKYLLDVYATLYKKDKSEYRSIYSFLMALVEYKTLKKFETSYLNKLNSEITDKGIFYTSFNMTGTLTGRLSSFFHTIPAKTELGNSFKRAIIPHNPKDFIFLSADYSQAEPRVLASMSEDSLLIKSYKEGKDLYKYMYSQSFDVDYEKVTHEQRNTMKVVVLAISYGMGISSLAKKLSTSNPKAYNILTKFFDRFEILSKWREEQMEKVKSERIITTPFGRLIPILDANSSKVERIAVNYLIQSTASDICMDSFYDFNSMLSNLKSFTVGSVQDSVEIEIYIPELFKVVTLLNNFFNVLMVKKYPFIKVPFKIEIDMGISWGSFVTIDKFNSIDNEFVVSGLNYDYIKLKEVLSKFYNIEDAIVAEESYERSKYSILPKDFELKTVVAKLKFKELSI